MGLAIALSWLAVVGMWLCVLFSYLNAFPSVLSVSARRSPLQGPVENILTAFEDGEVVRHLDPEKICTLLTQLVDALRVSPTPVEPSRSDANIDDAPAGRAAVQAETLGQVLLQLRTEVQAWANAPREAPDLAPAMNAALEPTNKLLRELVELQKAEKPIIYTTNVRLRYNRSRTRTKFPWSARR